MPTVSANATERFADPERVARDTFVGMVSGARSVRTQTLAALSEPNCISVALGVAYVMCFGA